MFVLLDDKKLHLRTKFDKPMLEIQKLRFTKEMDDSDNGFEIVRKYAREYFELLESPLTEKYGMVETFRQFKPPKLKKNERLKVEDLRIFMTATIKIAMGYNLIEPEPSLDEKIRFRMQRFYKKVASLYSNKIITVNKHKLFTIEFFPHFFDEMIGEMHRSGYTEEDKELEANLIKVKGIFPLGTEPLPGMPKSEFLYYSFLQKNQKGFCFDDLRQIFSNFNLFGFAKNYFVDEPEKGSNYEDNKLKTNHFLAKNKDDLEVKFRHGASIADYRLLCFDLPSDYNASHNKKRRFRYDRMNINDVFNYLRRVFEEREELQVLKFYDKRVDTDTFFTKRNSLGKVLELAREYFFKYMGISRKIYKNVNYVDICYDVVWEFFDFILRINGLSYIDYHSVERKHTKIFDLRQNLIKTIEKYKKKEELCSNDFEIKILRTTIQALENQLKEFEGQATEQDAEKIKAEMRLKNLKEIFNFYSKQHVQISANDNTFDHLKVQLNTMALSDWTCFCRDFNLNSKETNLNHRVIILLTLIASNCSL